MPRASRLRTCAQCCCAMPWSTSRPQRARQRLAVGRPVTYIDATHLTIDERRPYIRIAQWYGCEVEAIFFDVPLEICRERNALRARVVPDEAMAVMAAKLVPPAVGEGFSRVTVVR